MISWNYTKKMDFLQTPASVILGVFKKLKK